MSESVNLPALGESVTEGTVTRWLKSVGDRVEVDEPLVEVSTDKVDTEIPSPIAGIIEAILVAEDETVEVGTPLVTIGDGSAGGAPAAPAQEQVQEQAPEQAPVQPRSVSHQLRLSRPRPPPSPPRSRLSHSSQRPKPRGATAGQHGGSGRRRGHRRSGSLGAADPGCPRRRRLRHPTGAQARQRARCEPVDAGRDRRRRTDPQARRPRRRAPAAATPAAPVTVSPLRGTTVPMSRLRKVIAERAVLSLQASAQLTTVVEVDVTRVAQFRDLVKAQFEDKTGVKLSFLPFFTLAAAEALKSFPVVNATIEGDSIVYPAHENISIAVDTERGLLTPVIRNASDLDLAGIAAQIADLADRTRNNKLGPDELAGGTFTVTNTGSRGALFDTPLVFLPQSAILGTGQVVKKPVVVSERWHGRDRHPFRGLPRAVIRPQGRRRCGCGTVPRRGEGSFGRRRLRRQPGNLGPLADQHVADPPTAAGADHQH